MFSRTVGKAAREEDTDMQQEGSKRFRIDKTATESSQGEAPKPNIALLPDMSASQSSAKDQPILPATRNGSTPAPSISPDGTSKLRPIPVKVEGGTGKAELILLDDKPKSRSRPEPGKNVIKPQVD